MSEKEKGGPGQARPLSKTKTHSICIMHIATWHVNMYKTRNLFLSEVLHADLLKSCERLQCQFVPSGVATPLRGGAYAA